MSSPNTESHNNATDARQYYLGDSGDSGDTADGIIGVLVMGAAFVAVVYLLRNCCKKAPAKIPSSATMATHDSENPRVVHTPSSRVVSLTSPAMSPGHNQEPPDDFSSLTPRRFSLEELAVITKNYTEKLGSGGYGVVYKGDLRDGTPVAVKLLANAHDEKIKEQFEEEVKCIGRTHHISLVRLYGYCLGPPWRALVYEYMEKGSLEKFLSGDRTEIDWPKTHEIAVGTAKGIAYLHEECDPRIIHCDIKPGNILLDGSFSPKVADFGLVKLQDRKISQISMSGFRGTSDYAAPEMREPNSVTYKCDVYSFGMLLLEIVGRRNHNENQSDSMPIPQQTWHMRQNDDLLELVRWVPETDREKAKKMLDVALLCIQHKPEARPKMSTVVNMLEGEKEIPKPEYPFE